MCKCMCVSEQTTQAAMHSAKGSRVLNPSSAGLGYELYTTCKITKRPYQGVDASCSHYRLGHRGRELICSKNDQVTPCSGLPSAHSEPQGALHLSDLPLLHPSSWGAGTGSTSPLFLAPGPCLAIISTE